MDALDSLWVDPGEGEELVHLFVEDGEVHALYSEPFGKPPALSLAEGAVLLAALAPFQKDAGKPARDAARKLRRAIPEPLRPEADRLAAGLDVVSEPPGPWAGALREAIEKRVETTLEYRAVADAAAEKRVVEPRLLFQRDGQWYLAAWNVAKEAEHLFRLDRIVSVELGTRVFGEHKGPPVARYAKRSLYFESGAEREVTLRFRARRPARARAVRVPGARERGRDGERGDEGDARELPARRRARVRRRGDGRGAGGRRRADPGACGGVAAAVRLRGLAPTRRAAARRSARARPRLRLREGSNRAFDAYVIVDWSARCVPGRARTASGGRCSGGGPGALPRDLTPTRHASRRSSRRGCADDSRAAGSSSASTSRSAIRAASRRRSATAARRGTRGGTSGRRSASWSATTTGT